MQGFSKFPGGPARDVETLKRTDVNGLKTNSWTMNFNTEDEMVGWHH